jgi:FkbM family methyltransferase
MLTWPTSYAQLFEQSTTYARAVYVGEHLVLSRILGILNMFVDTRDVAMLAHVAMAGCWEPDVTWWLIRSVTAGMRVAVVGANNGYYVIVLGALVGSGGRVFAFEPQPQLHAPLRKNIDANGLTMWTTLTMAAAGARDEGTVRFFVPNTGFVWGSVLGGHTPAPGDGQVLDVPLTTVDAVVGSERLDLVLIDAEGYEPQVLAGMEETIRRNPDIRLILEYSPIAYGDAAAFVRRLSDWGFTFARLFGETPQPLTADDLTRTREQWIILATRATDASGANGD